MAGFSSIALRPCKISRVVTLRQIQRPAPTTLVADIVEMKVALYQLDRQFVPNLGRFATATLANNGNAAVPLYEAKLESDPSRSTMRSMLRLHLELRATHPVKAKYLSSGLDSSELLVYVEPSVGDGHRGRRVSETKLGLQPILSWLKKFTEH